MRSVMHTMRMPQSMRIPIRLDYGDDGAFVFLLLILTLFLSHWGAGMLEYGIRI